jgi:chromosome partitioning protein
MEPKALRILVVNGKGGCGKTTIATNLAAAYAHLGHVVVLKDHDGQGSSGQWHEARAESLPTVHLREPHQRAPMYATPAFSQQLPVGTDRIVIDTPSAVEDGDLDALLRGVDLVLVPLLPSSIDIRAGSRFISTLLTHRAYKARSVPVGVIANRVRWNTRTHTKLIHFLECLDVPAVATFRDCALYTRLAEDGEGILDVDDVRRTLGELPQWEKLLAWIEEATTDKQDQRRGPRSASAASRLREQAQA